MKDFERIDRLSDDMSELQKALFAECKFMFDKSSESYDDNNRIKGAFQQEIAQSLQHILERMLKLKITLYATECLIKDCTYPKIEDSDCCRDHTKEEDKIK